SWNALNPASTDANVLLPANPCANPAGSAFTTQTNHGCVLGDEFALGLVWGIVNNISCPGCGYPPSQTVALDICGVAANAQITASHAGTTIPVTPVAVSTPCAGGQEITVPWTDVLVQASVGGNVVLRQGALPSQNVALTLQPQQPATPTPIVPE